MVRHYIIPRYTARARRYTAVRAESAVCTPRDARLDMAQPSLEELLSDVPREKLKLPCSDEDLCTLALSIPSWKELLPYLLPGQSDSTKNAIEEQYTSVERRRVAVLRKWRANRGKRATYEKLSEILWKRGWSHLVEKLCGLLVGHDTSSDSDEDSDDEGEIN